MTTDITYSQLLNKYDNLASIPYAELLRTKEWRLKRDVILNRDEWCCTQCKRSGTDDSQRDPLTGKSSFFSLEFKTTEDPSELEAYYRDKREFERLPDSLREGIASTYKFLIKYAAEGKAFINFDNLILNIMSPAKDYLKLYHKIVYPGRLIKVHAESTTERIILHVHHLYYVLSRPPWEYPEEGLKTLCDECHWALHQRVKIKVLSDENDAEFKELTPCLRCSGAGVFPQFGHVQKGICFRCHGAKYEELMDSK